MTHAVAAVHAGADCWKGSGGDGETFEGGLVGVCTAGECPDSAVVSGCTAGEGSWQMLAEFRGLGEHLREGPDLLR